MEKSPGNSTGVKKIAIIGPECTGKTTLASELAKYFKTIWIPEYARDYIESLNRKYLYSDVEYIANVQRSQINSDYPLAKDFVFFDTELIISKVWFNVVYQKEPNWLVDAIRNSNFDIYLLCNTDIPWFSDKVRENGGENREKLFDVYLKEINAFEFPYEIISGINETRINTAKNIINRMY